MRKLNSDFKTSFISESGAALVNNDYFAFVELDDYACYVIADGITDLQQSDSARSAVQSIILNFQENPSVSRRALRSCMEKANEAMLKANSKERLKASVTVIVSDYESIRYACAGNARFRVYREGTLKVKSLDMSLSQDLVDEGKIVSNVLSKHEERHNLYTYLGQENGFSPFVSSKIKLMDSDVIVLYTRGIWENLDEADLDDIFGQATDDPQAPLNDAEDMLLSQQIKDLDNYTLATIFVNKVFSDPNRQRRRRRIIKITIIVLIVVLILGLIIWFFYSRHRDKVDEMNLRTENTIACIQDNNYIRAHEEVKKGLEKAESLKDADKIRQLTFYLRLIESIIAADEALKNQKFEDAYEGYRTAQECSRYADNLGDKYIERKTQNAEEHLTVTSLVLLGDKLLERDEFDKAETRYMDARSLAIKLHSAEGKQQAIEALDKLYERKAKANDEKEKKEKKKLSDDLNDLIAMGDVLSKNGDFASAEEKYLAARALAAAQYDADGKKEALSALDKLHEAKGKAAEAAQKEADKRAGEYIAAAELAGKGDAAYGASDYDGASSYYNTALEQYTALADTAQITILSGKLQTVAVKKQESLQKQSEAATMEVVAKELYKQKEYSKAKAAYNRAQQAYIALGNQAKADEIKAVIDQIDVDAAIMATMPE